MNWTKAQAEDIERFKNDEIGMTTLERKYGLPTTLAMMQSAACIKECGRCARPGEDDCQPCADELVRQQATWESWADSLQP